MPRSGLHDGDMLEPASGSGYPKTGVGRQQGGARSEFSTGFEQARRRPVIRRLSAVLVLLLSGCVPSAPDPVRLVLVPPAALPGEADSALASEGLAALLLARLRALPEVSVQIDASGCDGAERPTHVLRLSRQLTASSAITAATLQHCRDGDTVLEQWVQPRQVRRDISAQAAWWVGSELGVPRPRPVPGAAVEEASMQGFLVALARIKRRTADDVGAARDALRTIANERPDFALAQAHLATAELLAFEYGLVDLAQALQRADLAIETALAIDPDLGMAHAARGLYWMNQDRYAPAIAPLARAAALDPGEAQIALWLGNALLYHGEPLQARGWLEQAGQLDPGLVSVLTSLGEVACLSGQEADCQRFLAQPEGGPMAGFMAALLRAQRGEIGLALDQLDRVSKDVNPDWVAELRGDLCGLDPTASARCSPAAGPLPVPRWQQHADQTANAALDLWRIDLGLSDWMRQARADAAVRRQLQAELLRLRQGGLHLPLLAVVEQCLALANPLRPATDRSTWAPMLAAWGCSSD